VHKQKKKAHSRDWYFLFFYFSLISKDDIRRNTGAAHFLLAKAGKLSG